MTGGRYSCSSFIIVDGGCSGGNNTGSTGNGDSGGVSSRKLQPLSSSPATGRCNNNRNRRPSTTTAAAFVHMKKTWKNVAAMLFAVAFVTTATATFYFNYAATTATACCVVGQPSTSRRESSNFAAAADDEPGRGKFGLSVVRASKLYTVCETRGYHRRDDLVTFAGRRRLQTSDSTTGGSPGENDESRDSGPRNSDEANETALIYFITPTYPRREQIAELTRLGQTLMHVPRLHWIVADDRPDCSPQIMNLLPDFSIPYTYIASPMPTIYRRDPNAMPRGVSNRRAALNWIRLNHDVNDSDAVIYFGDDDNTFHLDLFKEIRSTKKISMFPVGLIGEYGVSSPIINNGKVIGFFDSWPAKRKFPVDMAGFAINVQLLFKYPYATMPYKVGFEEDRFLSALAIQLDEIEPKAENCTRILVWHTQTVKKPKPVVMIKSKTTLPGSLATLLNQVTMLGIGEVSETTGVRSYMTKNGITIRV
ncbi:galactosylgalactosylxylosylprotein 3-beta-glucuronosyltransferase S-like [Sipha flava]|uniref:Galactosylgalactosylxylosylprotein 3-beta-glucuronosyltransferase n=1 Tax=Sipha flava TaxID=143950 RepID=A0A2S2QEC9_9HEMI|nr:galactosylgalactosylxylosylprotein 3-beta-glucuronosyltransferase S-like [Sipha flava]XP_025405623.1 galactosylgalactosylxylosylprotein 3-beta-glucuronosyltransferase S-like [Sipha flava]XP_025405624.1 galactosylgalactosylxylosylprotein 3-beta-glucuronosyltransferase S-like [Sipha flava]XP_025405625.1 galactosylgalactosylxylosylprotein 3-beta-glucuronosyltransferase S-like [Sipha flava]